MKDYNYGDIFMEHKEGMFPGIDGVELYYQAWFPKKPKGVVQIVHGFGEHSGRYLNIVNKLVPFDYAIYANDHRGHGKSGGIRTYVDSFDQFVEDAKIFYDIIRKQHPDLPIFMLGHSMGSFIATHFVKKYETLLRGLILSGTGSFPSGILMNALLKPVQRLMRFVSKFLPPVRIRLPIATSLSNDPELVKAYKNDPLVIKTITPQLALEMIYPILDIKNFISTFRLPLLIQCGSKDLIVTGLPILRSALKMEDQTVIVYKGLKHEVYNEVEKEREIVLNDLTNWLNKHL